jgi:F-type H+-transporting ATPase subunit c
MYRRKIMIMVANWGAGIGAGIAAGLAVVGAGIGNGLIVLNALKSIARQPEMDGKIRATMIIGLGFVDGVAVIGILVGIILAIMKA